MSLLNGLKDEMTNPIRLANDEFEFGEAMEQDCVLEAATNARLSDEDIAAILSGDDDIPSDDDPEEEGDEALIEETACECFCASAYLYNESSVATEGFIRDLSDKFKAWCAYRKDRKQNLKARAKLREELQFKISRTKTEEVLKNITECAKGIMIDMTDTEISDARRKVQLTGDQACGVKKVNGIRFVVVSTETGMFVTAIGCVDPGALIKCLEDDPYKETPKWMLNDKNSVDNRLIVEFDAEFVALMMTAPFVPNDNGRGVMNVSIEAFLDSLPSVDGETPEEVMAATEAAISQLPVDTQIYLDEATEGLKETIQGLKDKHEAKKLSKAQVTVLADKLKSMKPEGVIKKFVEAAKPILLPMKPTDKDVLMDPKDGSDPKYLKVNGIDIIYVLDDNGNLDLIYAAIDPSKKTPKGVWGHKSKDYDTTIFNRTDIAQYINDPLPVIQAAAEEGWNQEGIDPDSPVMEHLLDTILSQR